MKANDIEAMDALINQLFLSDEASALTSKAARVIEDQRNLLNGLIKAAKKMGLSDVYGLLRANIADDISAEALLMRDALDMLQENGVNTEEPDLNTFLKSGTR